jgi:hypothetical protein
MSAIVSFGNIVNSLRSVRDEYNEHLKSVPQYEAFLLVESSTQKAADTLQDIASGTPSMAAEVVAALETAKSKFREHLSSIPEYRALLAIDKLINDVSTDLGVTTNVQPVAPAQVEESVADQNAVSTSAAVEETSSDQEAVSQEPVAEQAVSETDAVVQGETLEQPAALASDVVHAQDTIAELTSAVLEAGATDQAEHTAPSSAVAEHAEPDEAAAGAAPEEHDLSVRIVMQPFGSAAGRAA